jgi:hypothetical protein
MDTCTAQCASRESLCLSRISQDRTVNHSVGIAELRKVEVIRQNYPLRKEPLTIVRASPVARRQRAISQSCQQ